MNTLKTVALMAVLTVLLMWVGKVFGGNQGMVMALIFAGAMNFISYYFSDKIVLAMYRAKEVSYSEAPDLYSIVLNLTQKANLPMPKLYIIPSDTPNAFATGRNPHHAAVAVTSGILKLLNKDELEGVLGHELSHIKHRDILISSIVATVVGAIMMLAHMARWMAIFGGFRRSDEDSSGIFELLAMIIIAPIAAVLIQLAISRAREYSADEGSAKITGKPLSLASALEKLEAYSKRIPMDVNPSTAHMFIVNPLKGKDILALFSTHPPVEKRIERLRKLAYAY